MVTTIVESDATLPEDLLARARRALQQDRLEEAYRDLQSLLSVDPAHIEGLNLCALVVLRRQDPSAAVALLQVALQKAPEDPLTHHNLGLALEAAAHWGKAEEAYRKALAANPDLHVTCLQLGSVLERLGRHEEALVAYIRALKIAQKRGRWLDAATTPPPLRPLVERAVAFVRNGPHSAFNFVMQPLYSRFGRAGLRRVEKSLSFYLGRERREEGDPRQRPTFLYFPGLRAEPLYPLSECPWIEALEERYEAIRSELLQVLPAEEGREAVFHSEQLAQQNLRGLRAAPSWDGYYFFRHGVQRPSNGERCPATLAALQGIPLCRIPGHAPEVLFSVLAPGTHLLPHCGVTNTRLVVHLPLAIPPDCALKVASIEHQWVEGKAVVFDDTYEHEAWNRSDDTRVVLIADVWHPELDEIERQALTYLVEAIGALRLKTEG